MSKIATTSPSRVNGALSLGEFLRQTREGARITQREVAEALGVTKPYVSQVESDRTVMTASRLRSVSDLLALDEQDVFERAVRAKGRVTLAARGGQAQKVLARLWRVWDDLKYEDLNAIWRQLQIAEQRGSHD